MTLIRNSFTTHLTPVLTMDLPLALTPRLKLKLNPTLSLSLVKLRRVKKRLQAMPKMPTMNLPMVASPMTVAAPMTTATPRFASSLFLILLLHPRRRMLLHGGRQPRPWPNARSARKRKRSASRSRLVWQVLSGPLYPHLPRTKIRSGSRALPYYGCAEHGNKHELQWNEKYQKNGNERSPMVEKMIFTKFPILSWMIRIRSHSGLKEVLRA